MPTLLTMCALRQPLSPSTANDGCTTIPEPFAGAQYSNGMYKGISDASVGSYHQPHFS